jgi:hypothetical protein
MSLVKADHRGARASGSSSFTLPAIIAAVAAHRWAPNLVLLPLPRRRALEYLDANYLAAG